MLKHKYYVEGDQNVSVPAHINFGKYILDKLRINDGNKVALENAQTGEALTYVEFVRYAVNLSVSLSKLGVKKGDVIALGSEKNILIVPTAVAIILTGATFTCYDVDSGNAVLQHKLSISQPKYMFCSQLFWETYERMLKRLECIHTLLAFGDPSKVESRNLTSLVLNNVNVNLFEPADVQGQSDTAIILYSSGTTGMPKGVQISHLNCVINSLPDKYKLKSLDTALITGTWSHNYDTFITYILLSAGKKIVYLDYITEDSILRGLEKHQVNIAFLVPSMINFLAKVDENRPINLESLRIVYSRSSPLHIKTIEKVKQRFPLVQELLQGYGMTEAGELTTEFCASKGAKPGSVGVASPGITLKVVNPKTQEVLGPNQHGEIRLRGPVLMKGYIGIDRSSYCDEEGFFKTGDLGYWDDNGYFYVVDRIKEILCYDGFNVAPLELETILLLHPEVREAGVVGKPVPVLGEEPTAFVVKTTGSDVTEKQLIDHVAAEVPDYMRLRGGVIFVKKLPRNPRGKILRHRLREMLNETVQI